MKNKTIVLLYLVFYTVITLIISGSFVAKAKTKRSQSASVSAKMDHLQYELSQNFLHSKAYLIAYSDFTALGAEKMRTHRSAKKESDKSILGMIDGFMLDQELKGKVDLDGLHNLKKQLTKHATAFNLIVLSAGSRGNLAGGKLAELINSANALRNSRELNQEQLLKLFEHERNFLVASDEQDIQALEKTLRSMSASIKDEDTKEVLLAYSRSFDDIVRSTQEIGLHTNTGQFTQMNFWQKEMTNNLQEIQSKVETLNEEDAKTTDNLFLIYCLINVPLIYIFSLLITNALRSRFEVQFRSLEPKYVSQLRLTQKSA